VPPSADEAQYGAGTVELYRCNKCQVMVRFPRYNHAGMVHSCEDVCINIYLLYTMFQCCCIMSITSFIAAAVLFHIHMCRQAVADPARSMWRVAASLPLVCSISGL